MHLNPRLAKLQESATLAVSDRAARMRREGIDVVSLSAGEPDFDTPDHIKEAAIRALREGFTKYTAVAGIPELRQAIADRLRQDYGLRYRPGQVLVSAGAKHAIYNAVQAICGQGDEVIVFTPYWVSYPEIVRVADAVPVFVPCPETNDYRPDLVAFERAIGPRTRAVIVNSPNNPTGACFPREDLEAILALARARDLWVISDEIYDRLLYEGGPHHCMAALGDDAFSRTILINGMSKSYSMTGWRVGYAAGTEELIALATRLQGQSTSNITSISQKAALAALTGDHAFFPVWTAEFDRRRRTVVERLRRLPGVSCRTPKGAYYAFPNVSALFGKSSQGKALRNDLDVATQMLEQAHVAVVPGSAFGSPEHVRLSYATSMELLTTALDRLERWTAQIH